MVVNDLHVYHLCGSPTSEFFFDLSMIYAKDICLPEGWRQTFLVIAPNGEWKVGDRVDALGRPKNFREVLNSIRLGSLLVPHLFCPQGMSIYRIFFEQILGFPLVGSEGSVMELAADKIRARQVVSDSGVNIAPGGLVLDDSKPNVPYPLVIKPASEDNSKGVSLVFDYKEYRDAYKKARSFGPYVLVEKYVAGREFRVGLIKIGGEYHLPPIIEYSLNPEYPIRVTQDKLDINPTGTPIRQSSVSLSTTNCPAQVEEITLARVKEQAVKAHEALGARHYSLFDFKIDETTGAPIFLEAGLYWSFSPASMISKMLLSGGESLEQVVNTVWQGALTATSRRAGKGL